MAPSQLLFALNCSLVGLCSSPSHASDEPGPQPLPCLGLGIVRAVDAERRRLYVLSPLEEGALEQVTTVQVRGALGVSFYKGCRHSSAGAAGPGGPHACMSGVLLLSSNACMRGHVLRSWHACKTA